MHAIIAGSSCTEKPRAASGRSNVPFMETPVYCAVPDIRLQRTEIFVNDVQDKGDKRRPVSRLFQITFEICFPYKSPLLERSLRTSLVDISQIYVIHRVIGLIRARETVTSRITSKASAQKTIVN